MAEAVNVQFVDFPIAHCHLSFVPSSVSIGRLVMAPNNRASLHDDRWGDHIPWSLRYNIISEKGDFKKFMSSLATTLSAFFLYNQANMLNKSQFLARLGVESLQRFRHNSNRTSADNIRDCFNLDEIEREAAMRTENDPEEKESKSRVLDIRTRHEMVVKRYAAHRMDLIAERLEVLQSILFLLQQDKEYDALRDLVRHIRRCAADAGVCLNVIGNPPTLVPIEEPLLQKEVLERLLPRLEARFPDRAKDLIKAYHDLLKDVDTNTVFGNAFKALEQLARDLSGNPKLELNKSEFSDHFSGLHGTILGTITKLAAHRGDEGAHGRRGPDEYEIRYLLFSICNVALLLLDYREHCG